MITRRRFLAGALLTGAAAFLEACTSTTPTPPVRRPVALPGPTPSPAMSSAPVPTSSPSAPPAPSPPPVVPARVPPVLARRREYPVAAENARRGTAAWNEGTTGIQSAEGYLSTASVAPGERLALHAGASHRSVEVAWYRLGWYDGAGGRSLGAHRIHAARAARPSAPSALGLVEAEWPVALELEVPRSWTSGMYLGVLRDGRGDAGYVPFVVRPSAPAPGATAAPVLVVSASTTWQAYNCWGGYSLYSYNSSGVPMPWGAARAAQVSFDRPHLLDQGAGLLFYWEIQFIRWLERQARDVEYASDVDLVLHPEVFAGRRLVVFQGHHEYWSRGMRDRVEALIAGGTNVLFLSANEMYQQVRFGDSPLGSSRRVTCYKEADLDPMRFIDPAMTAVPWRDKTVGQPEAAVVGQMYGHVVTRPADWRVRNADHWLYEGTGLREDDAIVNLVGQEYDTYFPQYAPPGTVLLAQSPVEPDCVDPRTPSIHTATMYTAPSGATVFAAGTFQWSWALDSFGRRTWAGIRTPLDRRVGIMTANLLNRLGDGVA